MVSFWNKLWVDSTTRIPNHHRWVSANGFLETSELDHNAYIYPCTKNKAHARNWVLAYLDKKGFDKQVFLVSASGFFTDSYALFATNVILPSLAYIYWPSTSSNHPELVINCVTLLASACGQGLFGFLADKWGRRKLYGVELVIVIFGTLGMTQVSTGANQSMSILWWIIFWRFMLGLGIGAEYPLSACITAEFASTEYRATMMASVFLMQPLAQFCTATVGWVVLTCLVKSRGLDNLPIHGADLTDRQKFDIISTIDSVWRCVVGVGAIPALFAIIYRLSIPESPRYSMDVLDNGVGAFYDIRGHYNLETTEEYALRTIGVETLAEGPPSMEDLPSPIEMAPPVEHSPAVGPTDGNPAAADPAPANPVQHIQHWGQPEPPNYFTYEKLHEYFVLEGNWIWLAATSTCWFLLDFAFYGLGIDNPRRIAAIWEPSYPTQTDFQDNIQNWPSNFLIGKNTTTFSNATIPDWENPFDVESNIYQELYGNALRYVVTITVGSLIGSSVMIAFINKLPRKGWLIISFLILALLFLIMGVTLQAVEFHPSHWFTVVFYIICQFFFNWGPNTLTFIIPAEIFPTKYRCTCHGISAMFGKFGSLAVQGLLSRHEFTHNPTRFGIVLGCFTIPMTLGAIFAWGWLPTLQEGPRAATRTCEFPTLPSKTLEELAKGRAYATGDGGEVLTLKGKLTGAIDRFDAIRNGGFVQRRRAPTTGQDVEMGGVNGHTTTVSGGE